MLPNIIINHCGAHVACEGCKVKETCRTECPPPGHSSKGWDQYVKVMEKAIKELNNDK